MIPPHERYAIRAGLIPTFPEFVDYVIAKYPRGDAHWLPQIPQNDFCNMPYEYILKMENLTDEVSYLLDELDIPKLDLSAIGKLEMLLVKIERYIRPNFWKLLKNVAWSRQFQFCRVLEHLSKAINYLNSLWWQVYLILI